MAEGGRKDIWALKTAADGQPLCTWQFWTSPQGQALAEGGWTVKEALKAAEKERRAIAGKAEQKDGTIEVVGIVLTVREKGGLLFGLFNTSNIECGPNDDFDFSLLLTDEGELYVRERGEVVAKVPWSVPVKSKLCIRCNLSESETGVVDYLVNDNIVYTSQKAVVLPLKLDKTRDWVTKVEDLTWANYRDIQVRREIYAILSSQKLHMWQSMGSEGQKGIRYETRLLEARHALRMSMAVEHATNKSLRSEIETGQLSVAARFNKHCTDHLQNWWRQIPKDILGHMKKDLYELQTRKLYRYLFPFASRTEINENVTLDWEADGSQKGHLDSSDFFKSMRNLADIFCETCDAYEYQSFLEHCMDHMFAGMGYTGEEEPQKKKAHRSKRRSSASRASVTEGEIKRPLSIRSPEVDNMKRNASISRFPDSDSRRRSIPRSPSTIDSERLSSKKSRSAREKRHSINDPNSSASDKESDADGKPRRGSTKKPLDKRRSPSKQLKESLRTPSFSDAFLRSPSPTIETPMIKNETPECTTPITTPVMTPVMGPDSRPPSALKRNDRQAYKIVKFEMQDSDSDKKDGTPDPTPQPLSVLFLGRAASPSSDLHAESPMSAILDSPNSHRTSVLSPSNLQSSPTHVVAEKQENTPLPPTVLQIAIPPQKGKQSTSQATPRPAPSPRPSTVREAKSPRLHEFRPHTSPRPPSLAGLLPQTGPAHVRRSIAARSSNGGSISGLRAAPQGSNASEGSAADRLTADGASTATSDTEAGAPATLSGVAADAQPIVTIPKIGPTVSGPVIPSLGIPAPPSLGGSGEGSGRLWQAANGPRVHHTWHTSVAASPREMSQEIERLRSAKREATLKMPEIPLPPEPKRSAMMKSFQTFKQYVLDQHEKRKAQAAPPTPRADEAGDNPSRLEFSTWYNPTAAQQLQVTQESPGGEESWMEYRKSVLKQVMIQERLNILREHQKLLLLNQRRAERKVYKSRLKQEEELKKAVSHEKQATGDEHAKSVQLVIDKIVRRKSLTPETPPEPETNIVDPKDEELLRKLWSEGGCQSIPVYLPPSDYSKPKRHIEIRTSRLPTYM